MGQCAEAYFCKGFDARQLDGGPSLRSGLCTPRLSPGAACEFFKYRDADCEKASVCGARDTCVALGSTGSVCQGNFECKQYQDCPRVDAGTLTYTCAPFRGLGAPCGPSSITCANGFDTGVCNRDGGTDGGGTCGPLLAVGTSCTSNATCQSNRCFSPDAGSDGGPLPRVCAASCFP